MSIERVICALFLLSLSPLGWSQTKGPGIQGPDLPRGLKPSQPRGERSLREWLNERRQQKKEEAEAAGDASGGLPPSEVSAEPSHPKRPPPPPQPPVSAHLRWDLDLIYPKIISSGATFEAEPGIRFALYTRLSAADSQSPSFWLGFRGLSFSGQGRLGDNSGRFGWMYLGPAVAWEWLHFKEVSAEETGGAEEAPNRHRVGLGIAAVSRQGEKGAVDAPPQLASKGIGFDGPGLWVEYTYAYSFSTQCEGEFTSGLQVGERKFLGYLGLGFSLWLGTAPP